MLRVSEITFRIGGRTLFDRATAHVPAGHRVGLVGPNGSGKTTLLRLIAGQAELDGGSILVRSRARMGMVAQEAPGGDGTPLEVTLAADQERTALLAESITAEDPLRIAEVHARLVDIDAHGAPARAAAILAGLGFSEEEQHRPLRTFSGGWRMRVALAAVLFLEPDLLLLDEPTNHLDLESSLWLEGYLKSYPRTFVLVSHDRHFLDSAVDGILHLDSGKLELFAGGYSDFERVRLARLAQTEALAARQDAERQRIQAFVNRFRAKATKARQAQSRLKILERMAPIAAVASARRVSFAFPTPRPATSPLVRLNAAAVGYEPDRPVLAELHLSIFAEDRIALLGANGNGKTTLARLLAGRLAALRGDVVRSAKLAVTYFAQDQLEQLDPRLSALAEMQRAMPEDSPTAVRAWLGRFGLGEDQAEVRVSELSGGEKTRLALALGAVVRPGLLILDEPTNHLDIDAREALIQALGEYEGAIVLVSHDRHLVEGTAEQLWLVADGTVTQYFGDLDDYRDRLFAERRAVRSARRAERSSDEEAARPDRKAARRGRAEARAKVAPLRRQAEAAEARLEKLGRAKAEVDAALSDPSTYAAAAKNIASLSQRRSELEAALAAAEEEWLLTHDALEIALAEEAEGDGGA